MGKRDQVHPRPNGQQGQRGRTAAEERPETNSTKMGMRVSVTLNGNGIMVAVIVPTTTRSSHQGE